MFIVLEGIDGCGKTTIARMLAKKIKAKITSEPTRIGKAGRLIHEILDHKIPAPSPEDFQKLYIEDRLYHIKKLIKPALSIGDNVICQRYVLSTYAYGIAFGVKEKILKHIFLKPDLTILLDLPAKDAMKRIISRGEKREYFEKEKKLANVRLAYLKLSKKRIFGRILVVDARPLPKAIVDKIVADILFK